MVGALSPVARGRTLDTLVKWADCWQLRFNADKCKVLRQGQNNIHQTYSMKQSGIGERVTLGTSEGKEKKKTWRPQGQRGEILKACRTAGQQGKQNP